MDIVRRLLVAFTIGETSPRYWLVVLGVVLAFAAPATVFATNGVSPPLILRVLYSLLVMTVAGSGSAPADTPLRFRIAMPVTALPLVVLDLSSELWKFVALYAASYAAFGAGLAFATRNRDAYLSEEFGSD